MSYILEALKKSDQMRRRGAMPTLQAAQVTVAAPKRPLFVYYGLLAAALVGAGIMIGWLRPWQPEQPPAETAVSGTEPIAAKSPIPVPRQAAPAPLTAPPKMLGKKAQEFPAPNSTQPVQPVSGIDARKPHTPAPASSGAPGAAAPMPEKTILEKTDSPADVAQEQRAIPMTELPLPIRQEIPVMAIQLHAYSNKPMNRVVSINSMMLHEGESLTPGLRLEQITPDGVIFSYKGYFFQRGIR